MTENAQKDLDRLVGSRVAHYRGARSQAEIAGLMRERGFRWQQNTLSSVESGERPLRLSEAGDLADVLSVPSGIDGLLRDDYRRHVRTAALDAAASKKALEDSLKNYLSAQVALAGIADEAEASGVAVVGEARTLALLTLMETPGELALNWEIGMLRGEEDAETADWVFAAFPPGGDWTARLRKTYERLGHLRG